MKLILWVVASGLAGALLAIPQPVDPWEMPSLVLSRGAVSAAVRRDEELASTLAGTKEEDTLRSLFLDHGRAEVNPPYGRADYDRRQVQIYRAMEALLKVRDPEAVAAMRAHAANEGVRVFGDGSREPEGEYEVGVVGGFAEVCRRYGAIYRGVLIAPEMTVRALYKARWNLLHRMPAVEGFSPIELQAYWGWLALHGWGVELEKRKEALLAFRDAGGSNAREAAAIFDLLERRPDRAAKTLDALYRERGELRLRNLSLGALAASLPRTAPQ